MMLLAPFFILTFVFLTVAEANTVKNGEGYAITRFSKNGGIYYEYKTHMRLSTSNWRVAVFIETKKQVDMLDDLVKKREQLLASCPTQEDWCNNYINKHNWEDSWLTANDVKEEILSQLADLRRMENIRPVQLPKSIRSRRSAPLFGYIVNISGPATGILTYDDGEHIENSIQELNTATKNLSVLVDRQTHIVRAQLDNLHQRAQAQKAKIEQLQNALMNITKNLEGKLSDPVQRKYADTLFGILSTIKLGLLQYIKTGHKMLEVFRTVKKGQLHSSLISDEQLTQIIRDIQNSYSEETLPEQGPETIMEEIVKISRISILVNDDNLKIIIDIPLVDKTLYDVYKIHPLPAYQPILQNKTGRASIISEYTNIAIDELQRTYILFQNGELESCGRLHDLTICHQGLIIQEVRSNPPCEVQLLLDPTLKALNSCNILLDYNDEPYWKKLKTIGGWLYSVGQNITMNIKCPLKMNRKIQISGAGILELGMGCRARTSNTILPPVSTSRGITQFLYYSSVQLNLQNLSQAMSKLSTVKSNLKQYQITKISGSNDCVFQRNSKALDQLEQQLYDLASQRQMSGGQHSPNGEFYLGAIVVVIIIIVILFCTMRKCFCWIPIPNICARKSKLTASAVPTPIPRKTLTLLCSKTGRNIKPTKYVQNAKRESNSSQIESPEFEKASVSNFTRNLKPVECITEIK